MESGGVSSISGPFQHGLAKIKANHLAGWPGALGGNERIQSGSAAHIQHHCPGGNICQDSDIRDTGKGIYGGVRQFSQQVGGITQAFSEGPANRKGMFCLRRCRNGRIRLPYASPQRFLYMIHLFLLHDPNIIGSSTPNPRANSHKAGAGVPTGRVRRASRAATRGSSNNQAV